MRKIFLTTILACTTMFSLGCNDKKVTTQATPAKKEGIYFGVIGRISYIYGTTVKGIINKDPYIYPLKEKICVCTDKDPYLCTPDKKLCKQHSCCCEIWDIEAIFKIGSKIWYSHKG